MSEKKSPPHKEKASVGKTPVGDGKSNKRKLIGPGSPSEDDDKKNQQKRKRPNIVDGASPEHIGMGSPRGAGTVSRLSVPLSERQQMAILMKMADESSVGDTSPKSPSSGNQVSSTTKRTPADKKVNKRNERGEAPLHMAAKRGDYRQTKHLLKAGASVNMEDYAGWTALHEACNLGNIRVARYLLKAGADVNVQGFDDDTPLHDASTNGHRKLVQLLLRHGANPHQANLKGKTAIDVATTSQVDAILRGSSVNYSSDSGSELSSCDSIISTKEEDRNLEEELRLHGSQPKGEIVGSSSAAVTAVRRQSVPASPDKTASSPRLFMKLQHKKSSSSSSSTNEEQQRVSEWNVLTMETGSCDVLSDVDSSNSRPQEQRTNTNTSVGPSRLPKQEDGWNTRLTQPNLGRSNRVGVDSDGFPDSTISLTPAIFPTGPMERMASEPFTPRTMLPSIGDGDTADELGDVFPNSNSSSASGCINTKSNTSTSKSFNVIPICSNSSTSSSSVNKQLSPQHHSLLHAHQHNSPLRPSLHPSHQHHKTPQQQTPVQGSGVSNLYPRDQFNPHQGHSQPYSNSANISKESVAVSSSSLSSLPLSHRTQVSSHHSSPVIASTTISSVSLSLQSSSTVSTVAGIPQTYQQHTAPIGAVSSTLPASSSSSSLSNTTTTFTTDSRPSPHQLPFTPFSTRAPKAGGSIVTGLSDRALAACNSVGPPSSLTSAPTSISASGTTNLLPSQPLNSSSTRRDSSSPRIPLSHQRVEELSLSHPKSDTSSCDSPLCMDMDDSNNTPSENDSRPSTPKVPPLKIIMPGKVVVPSADDYSKPPNKPALPYVLNPTQEGAEAAANAEEGQAAINATLEGEGGENAVLCLPIGSPGTVSSNKGISPNAVDTLMDKEGSGQHNWDTEESASRESDSRNDQGDAGSGSNDRSEDGKEKRSTRTLRSHTAMLQQQGKTTTERNGTSISDKSSVIEQKDEGDNNSTTRSQKGDDSATDDSSFPPRKRKLRNKNEVQSATVPVTNTTTTTATTTTTIVPRLHQPLEKPPNPYETYLNLRRQIANRHRSLCNVPPKPPSGFKDYLMVNCTYVLQGNATSTLSVPMLPPPNLVKEPMREFFIQQEKARYRLRLQHVIEREKLMLSIEQEILREHGRAARAVANQTLPFSVCTILREEEIYNQQELEQDESRDKNVRSRYNGRQFLSWLQDVDDKYEKIKSLLLLRHHHEAESLYAVQKLDWEWKMKEFGLCDNKNTPVIDDLHVPMVTVSDEFDLLPSS